MNRDYYPHVPALRALAVAGPIMLHLWPASVPDSPLTERVTGMGFLGVELFFVISGFLITGILIDAREAPLVLRRKALISFYARRFLRIFPVYWLTLIVLAAAGIGAMREDFWWYFSYVSNFKIAADEQWPVLEAHFWSLAVEEQFYLAWPLAVLFLPRRGLLPAILLAIVAAPLFRWYSQSQLSPFHSVVLTPACVDVLGFGALLAWLRRSPDKQQLLVNFVRFATLAGSIGAAVHLSLYLRSPDGWISALPLARTSYGLLFVALLAHAADGFTGAARRLAECPPVVYLGTVSYGVYIFHVFATLLPSVWPPLARAHPLVIFAVECAATLALAAASWHLFERPLNSLRRFFPYGADRSAHPSARQEHQSRASSV